MDGYSGTLKHEKLEKVNWKVITRAGKGVVRAGTGYNNLDHMNKYF